VNLIVQPGGGVQPLLRVINHAKTSIEIVIFRFDQREVERALANAVSRGVAVHALIAHTNRAGEESLRSLELRLLASGVTVARSADDLARYHGKLMIVDRRELYLLAFNLTHADIDRSRSFGLITRRRELVQEAVRLFEADSARHPYEPRVASFLVSPINARQQLEAFIRGAKKELLIYDPKVSDPAMSRLLAERAEAGVAVKLIGRMTRKAAAVEVRKLPTRLHTRTMIRDRSLIFVGSQSLREIELDGRREVGLIFRHVDIGKRLRRTFLEDWTLCERDTAAAEESVPSAKIAKRVAKALTREMPPVAPLLDGAVRELVGQNGDVPLNPEEVEEIVKDAVKDVVREVVRGVVEEAVEQLESVGEPDRT
jgi:phosphatidylserine/phosphatidylglycerophosphate/cardiolipin synthase-like enzyme